MVSAESIYIGSELFSDPSLLLSHVLGPQALIVTNETVAQFYLKDLQRALQLLQCDVVILPDGECHKNQDSLALIYDELIEKKHHRDTTLIALGGGVIGDITGFAAATYQRGVAYIQCPTTLLAQIDASIGGKTAINHPKGKNMMGCFHQPQAVFMDLSTLDTLPEREFRAGLAEMIKYAILVGGDFLKDLTTFLEEGLKSSALLASLIAESVQIKLSFVKQDEREQGHRALLNLGHTFAHALEAYTDYKRWLHGEAVAIGLMCAARLSKHGTQDLEYLIDLAGLPKCIPSDIHLEQLIPFFFNDKKIKNNQLRFVLIRSFGDCFLSSDVSREELRITFEKF